MIKLKRLAAFLLTVTLIVVGVQYAGHILRPTNTDSAVRATRAFHYMPENSMEVIGFGSSHMWRGMDPRVMYEEYGLAAYNYGCNWQHRNTTTLFIEDALRTQTPKVILIDTFLINSALEDTDVVGEIYYTKEISHFDGKQRYLQQCFGDDLERYFSYYVPLCAFHDNWVNISAASFAPVYDNERFFKTMGFVGSTQVTEVTLPEPASMQQKPLSEESIANLDYILALCKEKEIDVILFTAPYESDYVYPYTNALTEYAEKAGCAYFNMFAIADEVGFDGTTDFSDKGHLNTSGAGKVASFLGKYISENYDMTDMRTVENSVWKQYLETEENE